MKDDNKTGNSSVINENGIRGEKIIFDVLIKEKLAHVIVIKDKADYHINLDGEDLGYYTKTEDGSISRFPQPKGAHLDPENYFKPIEEKVQELENTNPNGLIGQLQSPKIEEVNPQTIGPKDGLDNTGTQGYDSLTDDAFTGSSKEPLKHPNESESRTGSSASDFHDAKEE